jgi:hypothetical protein
MRKNDSAAFWESTTNLGQHLQLIKCHSVRMIPEGIAAFCRAG